MQFRPLFLLWLLFTLSLNGHAQFSDPFTTATTTNQDTFLTVEQAYQLNAEFETKDKIRLNWQIADDYYLYKHSFKFQLLQNGKPTPLKITLSPGLKKHDEYFGDVEVYYQYLDVDLSGIPDQGELSLQITSQGCADAGLCYPPRQQFFSIDSQNSIITEVSAINSTTLSSNNIPATSNAASKITGDTTLVYAIAFALLGGAILNLMPCVFPVLSLKVLGFANDKSHLQALHGLSYTLGVVISFIAVAGLMISLKAAGEAVGWGFQLQTPWFVAALVYLFFMMGLSLSGYIELGNKWMGFGGKLTHGAGYTNSFFTGILATVVASPCTAPFMGSALGYAVNQNAMTALLVFAALGLGMALPVLILSYSPKLLSKLPKPGPWMDQLKQLLAFPLFGAALWLCWVVGKQTGVDGMLAVLIGCLLLTLALWLWHERLLRRLLSAATAALAVSLLSSSLLSNTPTQSQQNWQNYTPQTLSQLRSQGQPVFVNLTADWCITCLTNEKMTLNTTKVRQAFEEYGIHYLKGDWTNYDAEITALLERHQRTGVPLYLLYPPNADAVILPQLLTTNDVLKALKKL